ncbi:MAG TPA: MerR family transcriptional regulator [Ferrovibrio sp.]|jgi:DNA-binding transcriptional MerR regulator|uniref:MerR family transcriptional regulator n=1 Tax=Ferrovibrio sp. TaxID=1917215 RepID=UPI002B4AE2ED|nr:MerR family transcriptional regulator [Ferrovibrio sp.]HLT79219.1 MerR family transcriptional regulator [Ferrovibrio sp.]
MTESSLERQTREQDKAVRSRTARTKTEGAFRTIGEVAEALDLPQHVLRFWEKKFHQIRPVKRSGGRRYYRTEDIALLTEIRGLLHDQGYTIRGVQKLLREGGLAKAVKARAKSGTGSPLAASRQAPMKSSTAADSRQTGLPFDLLGDMGNLQKALKTCLRELEAIHADIVARHNR